MPRKNYISEKIICILAHSEMGDLKLAKLINYVQNCQSVNLMVLLDPIDAEYIKHLEYLTLEHKRVKFFVDSDNQTINKLLTKCHCFVETSFDKTHYELMAHVKNIPVISYHKFPSKNGKTYHINSIKSLDSLLGRIIGYLRSGRV